MLYCPYVKIHKGALIMKIRFLLLGTSLSLIPQTTNAQCVATQDCATLGYTETSCSGGTGIKCPFGNYWACFKSETEIKDQLCTELSFTKTCTGTGYSGGSGKDCNGKYTSCYCASGYEWKNNSCQKIIQNGAQGELYYCNGTVVGVKASDMNFYIAVKDLGKMDGENANSSCQNYSFCNYVRGSSPTKEQLTTIHKNKTQINYLLSTNGGIQLTENFYWASTKSDFGNYYAVNMSNGSSGIFYAYIYNYNVRPILTSY